MKKVLTKLDIEALAVELRSWLIKNRMWSDVRIYFNGKAFATDDGCGNYSYNDPDKLYVIENVDPHDYIEYAGDILTISFEGDLYALLNYDSSKTARRMIEQFNNIFRKYGLYYEFGNAWNLTAGYL